MKNLSQFELKKELVLFFAVGVIFLLLLDYAFSAFYSALPVQAQQQQQPPSSPIIGIKITSPVANQQVPAGELTISGISTDNATTDCKVHADWNNKGISNCYSNNLGGVDDYHTWTLTNTADYHLIINGTNELTAKLSCVGDD